jgi:hypothetical protein
MASQEIAQFSRQELADCSGSTNEALRARIQRKQAPTFIDSPERTACTAFDALVETVLDMFCTGSTGAERTGVARVLHQFLDRLYELAARLDQGETGLAIILALTNDQQLILKGGTLFDLINEIIKPTPSPLVRWTVVSLNLAAIVVRERGRIHKVDIGDRFAMSKAEIAEIAKRPFRHPRNRVKAWHDPA